MFMKGVDILNSLINKILKCIWKSLFFIACKLPRSNSKVNLGQKKIRRFLASKLLCSIGENVNIEKGAILSNDISIGNNSGIGVNCQIGPFTTIGENVLMGPECIIFTTGHEHSSVDVPIISQGMTKPNPVVIGNDVWIGTRCMIMPGVRIGNGVIIGAGAVVTHNIPDYVIAAGVPARIVKTRK